MNKYEITVKNNTDTGYVKIKIITQKSIPDRELETMKSQKFKDVRTTVKYSYGGTVAELP